MHYYVCFTVHTQQSVNDDVFLRSESNLENRDLENLDCSESSDHNDTLDDITDHLRAEELGADDGNGTDTTVILDEEDDVNNNNNDGLQDEPHGSQQGEPRDGLESESQQRAPPDCVSDTEDDHEDISIIEPDLSEG